MAQGWYSPSSWIQTKSSFPAVSILGPVRPETQVELSASDARSIGVNAPCRESGDIAGSGACKLVGPAGEVELSEGVIVAKRHIHATPEDAEKFGLKDKEIVSVKINSNGRSLVFGDVVVRVSPKYALAMLLILTVPTCLSLPTALRSLTAISITILLKTRSPLSAVRSLTA